MHWLCRPARKPIWCHRVGNRCEVYQDLSPRGIFDCASVTALQMIAKMLEQESTFESDARGLLMMAAAMDRQLVTRKAASQVVGRDARKA